MMPSSNISRYPLSGPEEDPPANQQDARWETSVPRARSSRAAAPPTAEQYHPLFQTMPQGYFLAEIVRDSGGHAIDCRLIEVNSAFEWFTGVRSERAAGNLMSEVLPSESEWLETYDRVVRTGRYERFEHYFQPMGGWYQKYIYTAGHDRFICLYDDNTDRKRAERRRWFFEEINRRFMAGANVRQTVQSIDEMIGLQFQVKHCIHAELIDEAQETVISYGWSAPGVMPVAG